MATYPYNTSKHLLESELSEENVGPDDFSAVGSHHSRLFHSRIYYRFDLRHSLTYAEWNTLLAFYLAGPRTEHTFIYFGSSPETIYTVRFVRPPRIGSNLGNNRFTVEAHLRGYLTGEIQVENAVTNLGEEVTNLGETVTNT